MDGAGPGGDEAWMPAMSAHKLQRLQEPQQRVRCLVAAHLGVWRLQPCEGLLLHREVGLDISVRRCRALVAEPQGDHVERHARLQQVHGARVPERVRRDALGGQAGLLSCGAGHRKVQALRDVRSAHGLTISVRQQGCLAAQHRVQPEPGAYLNHRGLPQWDRSQLAALAVQVYAGATIQDDIHHAHADDLGDPSAGVVEQGQQQVVSLRGPVLARLPEHRQHLWACQEAQHRPLEALHRDRQRPLDVVQRSDITPSGELQERAQRREPEVATANRVLAALLQMVEECVARQSG